MASILTLISNLDTNEESFIKCINQMVKIEDSYTRYRAGLKMRNKFDTLKKFSGDLIKCLSNGIKEVLRQQHSDLYNPLSDMWFHAFEELYRTDDVDEILQCIYCEECIEILKNKKAKEMISDSMKKAMNLK